MSDTNQNINILRTLVEEAAAADDAKTLRWFPINNLPPLAFDHDEIIAEALKGMNGKW